MAQEFPSGPFAVASCCHVCLSQVLFLYQLLLLSH